MKVFFETGDHDWEYQMISVKPEVAIREIDIRLSFTRHTGSVWFDDIRLSLMQECELIF